jgi:hypothetical protein
MVDRTLASMRQKELFSDLAQIGEIVLTTTHSNMCSVNIHGKFVLDDKHWPQVEKDTDESLLALAPIERTSSGEPLVHFHVDWKTIKWAKIRGRKLDLIKTDKEIVFCDEQDVARRVFWFYARTTESLDDLIKKWKDKNWIDKDEDWIDLEPPQ